MVERFRESDAVGADCRRNNFARGDYGFGEFELEVLSCEPNTTDAHVTETTIQVVQIFLSKVMHIHLARLSSRADNAFLSNDN
jgi:hypothetical protein